ncbi:MAG: ABC transporter substrate binding protein [Pseudomonadota bacterium]
MSLPAAPVPREPDPALRAFLRHCAALGASLALPAAGAQAQSSGEPIAVLFPDLGEPFRKIFLEIIGGIEGQARQRVRAHPISANQNLQELALVLKRNGTRVLVALGRQGLKAAAAVEAPMGVVVGGMTLVPDGDKQFGICLTPDPALLFAQLKALLPASRRVIAVYNPQHNEWLMRLAREAARSEGLELIAHEARDLASAARLYQAAFASADGKRDALWLPIDPTTVDEAIIMPIVLRDSWDRGVPIFSSSLAHVNKGALFSLYPNNAELGRALAGLASELLAGGAPARGVTPLRDVYAALNTRTASHFGISVDARMQRAFNYVYPPV